METDALRSPQRPGHRRNASSKSNILRSLVSPKARSDDSTVANVSNMRTQTVPLLPPDHPHVSRGKVLGERQNNARSPSASPSKSRPRNMVSSKTSSDIRPKQDASQHGPTASKKSKSSTNLAGMFARMNRSSKDLSSQNQRDKENTTPPSSSNGRTPAETPIWAQYASTGKVRPESKDGKKQRQSVEEEINRYTPKDYSPSKQRNFNGGLDQPELRPTLSSRPKSMYATGTSLVEAIERRVSGESTRAAMEGRRSEDFGCRRSKEDTRPAPVAKDLGQRKISGSSTEQAPVKDRLTIAKRTAGGRVMAAVAAFQGKGGNKDGQNAGKADAPLDEKEVDKAFEAVLDSRNVPQAMRQKMRSLTLRVKADFIKQDMESAKAAGSSPPGTAGSTDSDEPQSPAKATQEAETPTTEEDSSKATKRSRPRSRTFTFSKADKRTNDSSPTKKQRSQSRNREPSTTRVPTTASTPRASMDKKRGSLPAVPSDYISYLRKHTDPVQMEVGRLHKLRILLRNETVAWVDGFLSLGGMTEIVGLLHKILDIEWREEHEDQLLHETLLCLKGLCTTERAMEELEKVADKLFPALIGMLFDEDKKGPAEYGTRAIVITVLFNHLAAAMGSASVSLEERAHEILAYLGEPSKPEDVRPVDFVLDMRVPRPYKLWSREVSNVTKEVFWIFLHHLNVIPLPRPNTSSSTNDSAQESSDDADRAKVLEATYTRRHFPGIRPPVPAAPYIGGVEWDATTYITAHLDLLNGLIASVPTAIARNALRSELRASGFEKVLGSTLRTCKEKFYGGVHDGLRAWVAAAAEDGWETSYVREGPTLEEQARGYSPKKSPKKKVEAAPKLEAPKLDLGFGGGEKADGDDVDDGWLG
ncbi:uncharacterized protein LTR77_001382 [Saxophila tyrrhenica]|uniref:Formin GTPase-binding domain-containing protein n=1 Tax=Saxophila tyrrhenica TaxID=1690608 RepID=A0AAV9PLZ1_9PEZI|nr:hypothetical protein LTR77_001382 [Saxophila tyrrhenica]